ncbi:MAG: EAL domain-containing protein [Oscillospiraceae bacterium]
MRKNISAIIIVIGYLIITAGAFFAALKMPEYVVTVAIVYFSIVLVSAAFIILGSYLRGINSSQKEKRRLSEIVQNINALAILWDADFHYIEVNDVFTSITGYTAADLTDNMKNLHKVLPPDAFAPGLQAIVNNRDEEFCVTAKGGAKVTTVWNTSMMSVIREKHQDRYIMLSIGLDLTEKNRLKEDLIRYAKELAASENKLTMSMEISEIGLLLKEPDNYLYYLSEQLRKMLGISSEYITSAEFAERIHPKDVIAYEALTGSMTAVNTVSSDMIHSAEFRMMSADGTYHWYQFRYKITPAENIRMAQIGGAILDITKDKEKDSLIERMAYVDDVTKIYNRNKFMTIGQETFECSKDSTADYWVIVLDIDSFHIINDTCGYLNGNKLLADFAGVVLEAVSSGGFAARIGGDNFAMLIRDTGDDSLPVEIIKRIQSSLADLSKGSLANQTITCSAGYCKMSDGGDDFAQILDHAEFSLSMTGDTRSSVIRYDNKVHDKIIESTAIENDLANAIENHELVLYYQPKINLTDGTLIGMEALIRWIKPDGTIVPPGAFIPVAESSMLITKISSFVLDEACRQNKEWQVKGYPPVTVSINLTAVDFYQTNVTESIKSALERSGLDAQWLDVELTESLAIKDIDHAIHQMEEIKALGVKLSMDDFGTGYSSLSYIQMLPITLLKLDRSFVMYLEEDEISREIVSAVIRIAKSKKIETIAEGIETPGQAKILKQSGCDHAQGYFFGKPMPADKFEEFMKLKMKQTEMAVQDK